MEKMRENGKSKSSRPFKKHLKGYLNRIESERAKGKNENL